MAWKLTDEEAREYKTVRAPARKASRITNLALSSALLMAVLTGYILSSIHLGAGFIYGAGSLVFWAWIANEILNTRIPDTSGALAALRICGVSTVALLTALMVMIVQEEAAQKDLGGIPRERYAGE